MFRKSVIFKTLEYQGFKDINNDKIQEISSAFEVKSDRRNNPNRGETVKILIKNSKIIRSKIIDTIIDKDKYWEKDVP